METLLLIIDTATMAFVLYWSMKNDRLGKGKPQQGLFRMLEIVVTPPPAPPPAVPARRRRRL